MTYGSIGAGTGDNNGLVLYYDGDWRLKTVAGGATVNGLLNVSAKPGVADDTGEIAIYGTNASGDGYNNPSVRIVTEAGDSNQTTTIPDVVGTNDARFTVLSENTTAPLPGDTGSKGETRYVSDYMYVCVATNTWVRYAVDKTWT